MCEEAAQRLATVKVLLQAEANGGIDDDGGYSIYTAIDLISAIQMSLRESAAAVAPALRD